jgi:RNA-directed DNA polymerase
MRLPHPLLESPFFQLSTRDELVKVLGDAVDADELVEIDRAIALGLPPLTSRIVLATMFGIHPGLVWSFENRPSHHYRTFVIPKGKDQMGRRIDAPRVALKIIQKWLSVQLPRVFVPADHVFGFVSGRSHVDAAMVHANARWVFSVDIENFFPTTPDVLVAASLRRVGFCTKGAILIARIACLRGTLAQGAPSSPVLSNLCFQAMDIWLMHIAKIYGVRLTRYADDIVFSGMNSDTCPRQLVLDVQNLFEAGVWRLARQKISVVSLPARLKVHGMLVHGEKVRLTKGYRNKLRAFRHALATNSVQDADLARLRGHVTYGEMVERRVNGE